MKKFRLCLFILATGLSTANAADLRVSVQELAIDSGKLYFALFERENFLQMPFAVASSEVGEATAIFRDVPSGMYAVSAYRDTNGNGILDRGGAGVPLEPYGFSNDARGRMGPPAFDAAAVNIGADNQSIVINLRKIKRPAP